ncbi:MAG: hypothetical protein KDD46_05155 [Bdellovibrionales bacterium]|nr:hypothetical protein [Bdellovibrionales bacterium]
MKTVKKTKEYTIVQKRSGRYGVKDKDQKWINGEEKVKVLLSQKLIKVTPAKPKEEPVAEAAPETPAEPATETAAS